MKTTAHVIAQSGPNTREHVLVDPHWLDEHAHDPNIRVVEVDVSPVAYDDWHIDGAVLWNVYSDLKDAEYRTAGMAEVEDLMRRSGIGPDTTVVFYGYAPCFGFWLLSRYGHRDIRILDCSRTAWRAGGHAWTTSVREPDASSIRLSAEYEAIRADSADVRAAIDQPSIVLVDVRSSAEYRGDRFWPSGAMDDRGRAGHVPSAVHQPIDGIYRDNGTFRSVAELRRVFSGLDLTDGVELITYCTIGGRAATAWFVLRYLLGRDQVRVYDGLLGRVGSAALRPVATDSDLQGVHGYDRE